MGLQKKALQVGVHIRAPDFWKLPCRRLGKLRRESSILERPRLRNYGGDMFWN